MRRCGIGFGVAAVLGALAALASVPLVPRAPQDVRGTDLPLAPCDTATVQRLAAFSIARADVIDAIVVLRDGQLVFQHGPVARPMHVASVRKSVLSLLFGIAADKGLMDLDATLAELGIDEARTPLTAAERQATLLDLLAARSGVHLPGDAEGERAASLLPPRESDAPGEVFAYANWGFNVLGAIFVQQTGLTPGQAFADWIAGPTGMQDFTPAHIFFDRDAGPSDHPAYRVVMSARDLARLGAVVASGGRWEGRRIVPATWIERSAIPLSTVGPPLTQPPFDGYGLSWWLDPAAGDMVAAGSGGQFLLVGRRDGLTVVLLNDTGTTLGRALWHRLSGKAADGHDLVAVLDLLR